VLEITRGGLLLAGRRSGSHLALRWFRSGYLVVGFRPAAPLEQYRCISISGTAAAKINPIAARKVSSLDDVVSRTMHAISIAHYIMSRCTA
jgi:hypothetical protein